MRALSFVLAFAVVATVGILLLPEASATCDPIDGGGVRCAVDFVTGRQCIVNPLWHVDPNEPYAIC